MQQFPVSPGLLMKGAGTDLLYFFLRNATEGISLTLKGLSSLWFQAHFLNAVQGLLLEVLHLLFLYLNSYYPTLLLFALTDLRTKVCLFDSFGQVENSETSGIFFGDF